MGKEQVANFFKRYAILFFLSLAIYGIVSSFHTVDFIASSIRRSFEENVLFVTNGRVVSFEELVNNIPDQQTETNTGGYQRGETTEMAGKVGEKTGMVAVDKVTANLRKVDLELQEIQKDANLSAEESKEDTNSIKEKVVPETQSKKAVISEEKKPAVNEEAKPIVNEEKKPIINEEQKPIVNEEVKPVVNEEKPIINEEVKPIINEEVKPIVNEEEKASSDGDKPVVDEFKRIARIRETRHRKQGKAAKPESNPNYALAMSRRPNYTGHVDMSSRDFKEEAYRRLNPGNHGICETGRCIKYISKQEVPYENPDEWNFYPDVFDITLVATATLNRMQFLPSLYDRWGGPACIALWVKDEDLDEVTAILNEFEERPQITTIIYHVPSDHPNYYDFPVNLLRNICIRNIRSSHFVFMDVDMWPTENMYKHLMNLPKNIMDDPHSTIIIPPVFLNPEKLPSRCSTIDDCFQISREASPQNKKSLQQCVSKKACQLVKPGGFAHLFATPKWLEIDDDSTVIQVRCLPTRLQEPYMVLKYTSNLPLFDERFVNYGYNKIQYYEHLKTYLKSYYTLSNDFAVDMYHPRNEVRVTNQGKKKRIQECATLSRIYK